ncbi:hypothetical protein RJ55_02646 [Drechmeria coniospora]|nr:hypothetical protein RJ55_02646 [Drechmeria coniospora]
MGSRSWRSYCEAPAVSLSPRLRPGSLPPTPARPAASDSEAPRNTGLSLTKAPIVSASYRARRHLPPSISRA